MFQIVRAISLNQTLEPRSLPLLVRLYRLECAFSIPRHYADKSHPNEFLDLSTMIPMAEIRRESFDKWKRQLDADDLQAISTVTCFDPSVELDWADYVVRAQP